MWYLCPERFQAPRHIMALLPLQQGEHFDISLVLICATKTVMLTCMHVWLSGSQWNSSAVPDACVVTLERAVICTCIISKCIISWATKGDEQSCSLHPCHMGHVPPLILQHTHAFIPHASCYQQPMYSYVKNLSFHHQVRHLTASLVLPKLLDI